LISVGVKPSADSAGLRVARAPSLTDGLLMLTVSPNLPRKRDQRLMD
jgi:hypothetical protein